jgi:hypothetical protein
MIGIYIVYENWSTETFTNGGLKSGLFVTSTTLEWKVDLGVDD